MDILNQYCDFFFFRHMNHTYLRSYYSETSHIPCRVQSEWKKPKPLKQDHVVIKNCLSPKNKNLKWQLSERHCGAEV